MNRKLWLPLLNALVGGALMVLDVATHQYGWAIVIAVVYTIWAVLTVTQLWLDAEKARLELAHYKRVMS